MSIEKELERTAKWVETINLDTEGLPEKQVLKNQEEALEINEAYTDYRLCQTTEIYAKHMELKKEIGDNLVTLKALCMQLDVDLAECLELANNKNYERIDTGKMIGGRFVKKEDFHKYE